MPDYTIPALTLLLATCAVAREKPGDYPVQAPTPEGIVAAEYLVHSFPTPQGVYFTKGYLVVEAAVFPSAKDPLMITSGQFSLRLNGKRILLAQSPGMVAASLKYADWEARPAATATAQAGDATVILGPRPSPGRFPGDPTVGRLPPAPRVEDRPYPTEQGIDPATKVEDLCQRLAWLNGSPNTADCLGLEFSFILAENIISSTIGSKVAPALGMQVYNPVGNALFFNNGGTPSVSGSNKRHLYKIREIDTPRYGGGGYHFYFWGLDNVTVSHP